MRLRTAAAVLLTPVLVSSPAGAVGLHRSGGTARAAYPEPQAGPWDYDRYISPTEIGRFRLKPGTGTKPPRVVAVRFNVESAVGKCPKIGTRVTVVAEPLPLRKAPSLTERGFRYGWVVAQNDTYDEDYADTNYGLVPLPVAVKVGTADAVSGSLSMLFEKSFEGGKWRWVVYHTTLSFQSCRLYSLSGRPTADR
jgi:hypothetical protein